MGRMVPHASFWRTYQDDRKGPTVMIHLYKQFKSWKVAELPTNGSTPIQILTKLKLWISDTEFEPATSLQFINFPEYLDQHVGLSIPVLPGEVDVYYLPLSKTVPILLLSVSSSLPAFGAELSWHQFPLLIHPSHSKPRVQCDYSIGAGDTF